MAKPICSLEESAAAMRHCIAACLKRVDDSIIKKAEAGVDALSIFAQKIDLYRMVYRLDQEYPHLSALFKAFPDARITDIRDKTDAKETSD